MSSLQPDINCLVCFSPISSKSSGSDQFQEDSFDLLQNSLDIPHFGPILKFSLCCQKCIYNLVEMVDILRRIDELRRKLFHLKKKFKIQLLNGHKCSQDPLGSAERDGIVDIFAEDRSRLMQGIYFSNQEIDTPEDPISELVKVELVGQSQYSEDFEDISEEKPSTSEERHLQDERIIKSFQAKTGINLKECEVTLKRIEKITDANEINVKRGPGRPPKSSTKELPQSLSPKIKYKRNTTTRFGISVVAAQIANQYKKIFKYSWVNCSICGIKSRKTNLGAHMKTYHPDVKFKAPRKNNSDSEPETPTSEELLNCKLCSFTTDKYRELLSHEKVAHPGSRSYICSYCQASFPGKYILSGHVAQVHLNGNSKFECTICGKGFKNNNTLERHSRAHKKNRERVKCPKCNKTYRQFNLEEHMKGCVPWICELCGKIFKQRMNYILHVKGVHKRVGRPPSERQPCPICQRMIRTKQHLKIHIAQMHRKKEIERNYSCEKCGKSYTRLPSLNKHLNTHLGLRSFKCKTCGKGFNSADILRTHEPIHETNPNPFLCPYCGKVYQLKIYLYGHLYRTKTECSVKARKERDEKREAVKEKERQFEELEKAKELELGVKSSNSKITQSNEPVRDSN